MNTIFLDFADTLGYRINPEIEQDLEMLYKYVNIDPKIIYFSYREYIKSHHFYERDLSFKNFESELVFTVEHFFNFLVNIVDENNSKVLSKLIADQKYKNSTHALYPEVLSILSNYIKHSQIFILSDGRPSRSKTLELLGLNKFYKNCFISDEIGFVKNQSDYYLKILKKIKIYGSVFFIDDHIDNLHTITKVMEAKCILMDRKLLQTNNDSEFLTVHRLPNKLT